MGNEMKLDRGQVADRIQNAATSNALGDGKRTRLGD